MNNCITAQNQSVPMEEIAKLWQLNTTHIIFPTRAQAIRCLWSWCLWPRTIKV